MCIRDRELTGESGRTLEVIAASIGGGRIEICEIDGLTANFSGDYPTLIVHNIDQPGQMCIRDRYYSMHFCGRMLH